jgi:hypothetical protein
MGDTDTSPTLFTLPLELREYIYKDVMLRSSHGLQLLMTCREIYEEARKFLFRRLVFRSQSALFEWFTQAPKYRYKQYLHTITDLVFELRDVDLSLLTLFYSATRPTSTNQLDPIELQNHDLEKLRYVFTQLPNVKRLTVRTPPKSDPLYRLFLAKFLDMLSSVWPRLQSLTLEGNFHDQSLNFLSTFRELRCFDFDGTSTSSPSETAAILSSLQHLQTLSIVSQYQQPRPIWQTYGDFTTPQHPITPEYLHAVNERNLWILNGRKTPTSPTIPIFTPEILSALHNHPALRRLTIRTLSPPNAETLTALQHFLPTSMIEDLELDFHQLDADTLDNYALLPSGLKDLWVRASSVKSAYEILSKIHDSREAHNLTQLWRVVLIRDGAYGISINAGVDLAEGAVANTGTIAGKREEEEDKELDDLGHASAGVVQGVSYLCLFFYNTFVLCCAFTPFFTI